MIYLHQQPQKFHTLLSSFDQQKLRLFRLVLDKKITPRAYNKIDKQHDRDKCVITMR